jgi:hypothetical protein
MIQPRFPVIVKAARRHVINVKTSLRMGNSEACVKGFLLQLLHDRCRFSIDKREMTTDGGWGWHGEAPFFGIFEPVY